MDWSGEGYILSVRKHGETSAIIDVFTREKGRHLGLVRGGVGRRLRPILQPGNKVRLEWRARLSEHLGSYTVEPEALHAAAIMENRLSLAGLNAACAVARETLPEREHHPRVYAAFEVLISNFDKIDIWPALYVKWEAGLLRAMGYGLDLNSCAATGSNRELIYVSPRSGRAVSREAGEPYKDKMLALPDFMQPNSLRNDPEISRDDISNGLRLTGYFLETRLQWGVNKTLPDERRRMVEKLQQY